MAVIPCHNQAARIGGVIAAVGRQLTAVMVVDDGSSDATTRIAPMAGAEVVTLFKNAGKGAALQAGWRRARARVFPWVLIVDGDGQHAAEEIPALVAAAPKNGAALVVGNRMGNSARMPWLRRKTKSLHKKTEQTLPSQLHGYGSEPGKRWTLSRFRPSITIV